jgi:hypothetical protein
MWAARSGQNRDLSLTTPPRGAFTTRRVRAVIAENSQYRIATARLFRNSSTVHHLRTTLDASLSGQTGGSAGVLMKTQVLGAMILAAGFSLEGTAQEAGGTRASRASLIRLPIMMFPRFTK